MITIYHLERSRSDRAVWLMEELDAPYRIEYFARLPTWEAEPAYKLLHPLGSSPVIDDNGKVIAESGAIIEYLATTQGDGSLVVRPGCADYADYLYWFHFSEATLMTELTREIMSERVGVAFDNPGRVYCRNRIAQLMAFINARLGEVSFFAGARFTAADIMMTFPFTTARQFVPLDVDPYPNIARYLEAIAARPAYQRCRAIAP